jgi:hypothetical protein
LVPDLGISKKWKRRFSGAYSHAPLKLGQNLVAHLCICATKSWTEFSGAYVLVRHKNFDFSGAYDRAPQKLNFSGTGLVATAICATKVFFGAPLLVFFLLVPRHAALTSYSTSPPITANPPR